MDDENSSVPGYSTDGIIGYPWFDSNTEAGLSRVYRISTLPIATTLPSNDMRVFPAIQPPIISPSGDSLATIISLNLLKVFRVEA